MVDPTRPTQVDPLLMLPESYTVPVQSSVSYWSHDSACTPARVAKRVTKRLDTEIFGR